MSGHPVDPEGRMIPDASWPPGRTAPGRYERARRFLNTTNRENGADHLGEPVRAARWLAAEGWAVRPSWAELIELRRFRDELYELVRQRWAAPWPTEVDSVRLGLQRGGDGVVLTGTGEGVERIVGDVLAIVLEARLNGTLMRLRVCDHCHWSYYDRSRNAGGHWCSMGTCGQREKMRRYRARRRAAASG
jgi:hypothetical protein